MQPRNRPRPWPESATRRRCVPAPRHRERRSYPGGSVEPNEGSGTIETDLKNNLDTNLEADPDARVPAAIGCGDSSGAVWARGLIRSGHGHDRRPSRVDTWQGPGSRDYIRPFPRQPLAKPSSRTLRGPFLEKPALRSTLPVLATRPGSSRNSIGSWVTLDSMGLTIKATAARNSRRRDGVTRRPSPRNEKCDEKRETPGETGNVPTECGSGSCFGRPMLRKSPSPRGFHDTLAISSRI